MSTIPVALWWFAGSVALAYCTVPFLLSRLKNENALLYFTLGEPRFSQLFSRDGNHLRIRFRFLWFVISGKALATTHGSTRLVAFVTWVAYVVEIGSLVWLTFAFVTSARH